MRVLHFLSDEEHVAESRLQFDPKRPFEFGLDVIADVTECHNVGGRRIKRDNYRLSIRLPNLTAQIKSKQAHIYVIADRTSSSEIDKAP